MTKLQGTLFDDLPIYLGQVSKHSAHRVWKTMMTRCYNPNNISYQWYGGRGIRVCDEWRNSSRAFVAWAIKAGYRPGLELDRLNNEGPYSPRNCRFVTRRENNLNTRRTRRFGDGRPAWLVAQANGLSRVAFDSRLRRGWSLDQAATISKGGKRPAASAPATSAGMAKEMRND